MECWEGATHDTGTWRGPGHAEPACPEMSGFGCVADLSVHFRMVSHTRLKRCPLTTMNAVGCSKVSKEDEDIARGLCMGRTGGVLSVNQNGLDAFVKVSAHQNRIYLTFHLLLALYSRSWPRGGRRPRIGLTSSGLATTPLTVCGACLCII